MIRPSVNARITHRKSLMQILSVPVDITSLKICMCPVLILVFCVFEMVVPCVVILLLHVHKQKRMHEMVIVGTVRSPTSSGPGHPWND